MPTDVSSFKPNQIVPQANIIFTHNASAFIFAQNVTSERGVSLRCKFISNHPSLRQAHHFAYFVMKRHWKMPLQQFLGDLQCCFGTGQQQIKYRFRKSAVNIMIPQLSYEVVAASRARQCFVARNLPEFIIA